MKNSLLRCNANTSARTRKTTNHLAARVCDAEPTQNLDDVITVGLGD
jgi:hypothetical protein